MNTIKIERQCTISKVSFEGQEGEMYALELPDRDNLPDISCIPPGRYKAIRHISPSKGTVWWLQDVPGRTKIYLHIGNRPIETRGCILPGTVVGTLWGGPAVLRSGAAMKELMKIPEDEVWVEVSE